MIVYKNLTEEQVAFISNGCGTKNLRISVPVFTYEEACIRHDFDYSIGGNRRDRLVADKRFLYGMLDASDGWVNKIKARIFYMLVRTFGWISFNYGTKKTLEDLKEEMKNAKT